MKHLRWQFVGVSLALVALFLRSSSPAKSSATIAGAAAPAGASQLMIAGNAGGTATITGFQLPGPMLTAQTTGVGNLTFTGPGAPSPGHGSFVARANIDVSQMPPALRNGTITVTAVSGDQIQATFQGQTSVPDAGGYSDVNATYTITGGTGKYSGAQGTGTVTGTLNFMQSAFALTTTGFFTPPPAAAPQ